MRPGVVNTDFQRACVGANIANAMGVPGTLGFFACGIYDGRPVLLTSWHVLFGSRGAASDPVWLVDRTDGARRYTWVGSALYGKLGSVRFGGNEYHVDCAVASCEGIPFKSLPAPVAAFVVAQPGDRVTKTGAATGTTVGIIVDTVYRGSTQCGGRIHPVLRQLLIRSENPDVPFSTEGDSGALIFNEHDTPIGLLWGTTAMAEGVACPIGPVLHALNIQLCEIVA